MAPVFWVLGSRHLTGTLRIAGQILLLSVSRSRLGLGPQSLQ